MKIILGIVSLLVGLYLSGIRHNNPRLDNRLKKFEDGYNYFNSEVKKKSVISGIEFMMKYYGVLTAVNAIAFIFLGQILRGFDVFFIVTAFLFLCFDICWFSLYWCIRHKVIVRKMAPIALLFVLTPFLISILDLVQPFDLISSYSSPIYDIAAITKSNFLVSAHPIIQGTIISITTLCFIPIYYLGIWLFSIPIAFLSASVVIVPIWSARIIDIISPKQNFYGLIISIFMIISLWQIFS